MRLQLSTLFLFSLLLLHSQTLFSYSQRQTVSMKALQEFSLSSQSHKLAVISENGEVYVYTQNQGLLQEKQKLMEGNPDVVNVEVTADG